VAENVREIVLDILLAQERGKDYSHRLIRGGLDKYDYLESRDKSFIKRAAEGTLERRIELDYYLDQVSAVKVRKMKPLIRCLLRMSAYQLLYMDSVPDSAVCNEACNLAGKRGFKNLKGFVNGVLRSLAKQKGVLSLPDKDGEPVNYLGVRYSMPEWIVKLWLEEYGQELTETMLAKLQQVYPVSLRFDTGLGQEELLDDIRALEQGGSLLKQSRYLPYVYTAEHTENIGAFPGFQAGRFTVQDVSSALAVEAAGIREGDFVMDVCAAPGGKSLLAAEKAGGGAAGIVLARDVSQEKVSLIQENIQRMRAENVQVQVHDAAVFDEAYEGKADVVLVDAPCSGLGIMGKKRDIKYRVTKEGLADMAGLQRRIVEGCWRYVKPGGILLYSTCTVNPGENEEMVRYIAGELPFEPVSLEGAAPEALLEEREAAEALRRRKPGLKESERAACIQLFPGMMECDGFFFAKFRRI